MLYLPALQRILSGEFGVLDQQVVQGLAELLARANHHQPDDVQIATLGRSPQPSAWQPIETAPKDGTPLLIWVPGTSAHIVHLLWKNGRWEWLGGGAYLGSEELSHWMPLPDPPVGTEEKK